MRRYNAIFFLAGLSMVALVSCGMPPKEPGPGSQDKTLTFTVTVKNTSDMATMATPFSPGVWVVHQGDNPLFTPDKPAGMMLEALAEDGDPQKLGEKLKKKGTEKYQIIKDPIAPGKEFSFTVQAKPGERLTFVVMFVQSNDLFLAPVQMGIPFFDAQGMAQDGDVTSQIKLWDAGTEKNQKPGEGADQPPRQKGPNQGPTEKGVIQTIDAVNDGFQYPAISNLLQVTLAPQK